MKAHSIVSIIGFLATGTRATVLQRAPPRFDIYLHSEEHCPQHMTGKICENVSPDECCFLDNPQQELFSSADYALTGYITKYNGFDIEVFGGKGGQTPTQAGQYSDPFEPCGVRASKDDTCATAAWWTLSGASVDAGSVTPTKRGARKVVKPSAYVYRKGNMRWTVQIDSQLGRDYQAVPKGRKEAYLMQHGTLTVLKH